MKKIDLKKLTKRIRDRNYRFSKMTPAQQRVRIAKDVIEQLGDGILKAQGGTYLSIYDLGDSQLDEARSAVLGYSDDDESAVLCDLDLAVAFEQVPECTVCGIGAAFVATVKRADDLTMRDVEGYYTNSDKMRVYLRQWFEPIQIGLIECAFERSSAMMLNQPGAKQAPNWRSRAARAADFGSQYSDAHDRLIAIMRNIVENDGEFSP